MAALSTHALHILEQMEPNLGYQPQELRSFVPDLSMEALHEVMHELWIERQVERCGASGWRRVRSTCSRQVQAASIKPDYQPTLVKPEELFDHDTFSGFFK